jgi:hypothetical protein
MNDLASSKGLSIRLKAFLGIAVLAATPAPLSIIELQVETLKAWEEYIRDADLRMQAGLDAQKSFLWTDESPDRIRRVRSGETAVAPVVGHGTRNVPNGLIHDWIGGVFIPRATIESLLAVTHDYNRYKDFYKPVVADSKLLDCTATDQKFSMVWQRKVLFVNAAIEGEYHAHDVRVDARRGYNVTDASQVREIENYGRAGERLLPPGMGNGFIWRLHSIARYQERDGGVYLELEAIALTRDIPASLRWLVTPVVNHLSMNSLTTTLRQTRDAVNSLPANRTYPPCSRIEAVSPR